MPLISDRAFVLETYPYGERDVVAVLFAREHGLVRVSAKGARARLNRFGGALQTLNEIEAAWFTTEGRELGSLREARAVREFFPAVEHDSEAGAVAAWVVDHLRTFGSEMQINEKLYRLATHLAEALLAGAPRRLIARYAEVWILKLTGIFPRVDACGRCGESLGDLSQGGARWRDAAGHFFCESCGSDCIPFSSGAARALAALLARPLTELAPLAVATDELAEIEGLCSDLRRQFLGKELPSWPVVKQMLQEV